MPTPFARRMAAYQALRDQRPKDFEGPPDGVLIATDVLEIQRIEAVVGDRYEARGWPREWAEVGVAYQDPYLRLLRDAVTFPGGSPGIHHRVLSNSRTSGAAVLPLLGDRAVLIRHFRHPSRRWHWEIPRGGVEPGATSAETVAAELREEIGAECRDLVPLGSVYGSTSLISGAMDLFVARIASYGLPQISEGITAIREFSLPELEGMIDRSEITDSFTLATFLRARLKGLL